MFVALIFLGVLRPVTDFDMPKKSCEQKQQQEMRFPQKYPGAF